MWFRIFWCSWLFKINFLLVWTLLCFQKFQFQVSTVFWHNQGKVSEWLTNRETDNYHQTWVEKISWSLSNSALSICYGQLSVTHEKLLVQNRSWDIIILLLFWRQAYRTFVKSLPQYPSQFNFLLDKTCKHYSISCSPDQGQNLAFSEQCSPHLARPLFPQIL